jgi:hypothetical protein
LKAGVWLRRGLLLIVSPVRGYHRRYQAETPLIDLFKFASPALNSSSALRRARAYGSENLPDELNIMPNSSSGNTKQG